MNRSEIRRNMVASLIMQVAVLLNGLILPRIILAYFGSTVNGLVSSANQFINYVSLLEAGVGGVVMASLYKPLYDNDVEKVSQIVAETDRFFKRIGILTIIYTIAVSIIYPLLVKTGFSYKYSVALICVLGMNLFVQYFFSITYKILLNADRKGYVVSITQTIIILLNLLLSVLCVQVFPDILVVKALSSLVFLIQPLVFSKYIQKHYSLNLDKNNETNLITNKWDGLGVNIAAFIHNNTDIVVLTIFCSLNEVSVYSIYFMVLNAIKCLLQALSGAVVPSIGKELASNELDRVNRAFNSYLFFISYIVSVAFSCTFVLIIPFVLIYTHGITDVNYYRPIFGILLCSAEMVYCFRDPYISITYAAGKYKEISRYAYIEAVLNILISVVLVNRYGIIGVSIGTLVAMITRTVLHIYYLKNHILFRSIMKSIKNVAVYFCAMLSSCLCGYFLCYFEHITFSEWIFRGMIMLILSISVTSIFSYVFYRNEFISMFSRYTSIFKSRGLQK